MNISQRLRTCAKHTGLDAVIELLNEAADEIDRRDTIAQATQPAEVTAEPDLTSGIVNDACWKFVEAMPHQLPVPIWNDLKPAIYASLIHYHRAILALRPVQVPMTDADTVQVFGVKDGKETLLGTAPMPARMKARELARENFGNFEDGDGSDAELCFGALEQLIYHIERNAHHGITAQAKKEDK